MTTDLVFDYFDKFILTNIEINNSKKVELGELSIPFFEFVEISKDDFNNLNRKEKKYCEPIYAINHFEKTIIGYSYIKNKFRNYVIWKLNGVEKKITDFKYCKRTKTIKIGWKIFLQIK